MSALLSQRTTPMWHFIFFDQFQIALPPEQIEIILHPGIGPVGAIQYKKSELPPLRRRPVRCLHRSRQR
jgi:hypothetical protein